MHGEPTYSSPQSFGCDNPKFISTLCTWHINQANYLCCLLLRWRKHPKSSMVQGLDPEQTLQRLCMLFDRGMDLLLIHADFGDRGMGHLDLEELVASEGWRTGAPRAPASAWPGACARRALDALVFSLLFPFGCWPYAQMVSAAYISHVVHGIDASCIEPVELMLVAESRDGAARFLWKFVPGYSMYQFILFSD